MKHTFVNTCIAILISLSAQAQETYRFNKEFLYTLTYFPDSTHQEPQRTETMQLLIGDTLSLFRSLQRVKADSINKQYRLSGCDRTYTLDGKFIFQIVKTAHRITYLEYRAGFKKEEIKYVEPSTNLSWEVLPDLATIAGLPCQAAEVNYGGRRWKAYFSTEIPIMDGPFKFMNLPGLIIKVSSDDGTWDFTLSASNTNVDKIVDINKYPHRKVVEMDKETFHKELNFYIENRLFIDESTGKMSFPTAQDREVIAERYKNYVKTNSSKLEKPY